MTERDIASLPELQNLSEEESRAVMSIVSDLVEKGKSQEYDNLLYRDYEEIPVSIHDFLHLPQYLGKGLTDEEGRFTIFPYWEGVLEKLFPDPLSSVAYNTLALTGAIGLGKSTVAVITGLYELYRMLCLKDPYLHYGLQPIDKITFAFMNITLDASGGVAWDKCQQMLQSSSWFMAHGKLSGTTNIEWKPNKKIELIVGSLPRHILGRALWWSFMDEVSFQPSMDVNKQKEKAKELVNTAANRQQSRFMKGEKNPTLMVLASSKRTEQSYLEEWIADKKRREIKTTLVVDEPQWVIRTDKVSGRWFSVAVGNKFLANEVVPLDATPEEVQLYRDRGYTFLQVPMGYYGNFMEDIDEALTDIAGISTTSSNKFLSGQRITAIINKNFHNLFTRDIISVGNAREDTAQYYEFIDQSHIDPEMKSRPLYVHMDLSESGDKTGIAGVWVVGKKPSQPGHPEAQDLYYRLAFCVSVEAPKGYQISFEKDRQFIYWLRESGFNIKGVSTDNFAHYDMEQSLVSHGFNYEMISMDRVDAQSHVCYPYQYLRNTIYEERIEIFGDDQLLLDEWLQLEKDNTSGKIDHPTNFCLTADTKVSLCDGRELNLLELIDEFNQGKRNYVYSISPETLDIEPDLIVNAFPTLKNTQLVEVTLDSGEVIKCTPNHKFMLRDGTYCEAQSLTSGTSLMPLYRKYPNSGALHNYRMFYSPAEGKWHFEHRQFCTEVDDKKYLVHHKNCNPKDNSPTNLVWMSRERHHQIHDELQAGAQSQEARAKRIRSNKAFAEAHPESYTERAKKVSATLLAKNDGMSYAEKRQAHIAEIEATYNIKWDELTKRERNSYGVRFAHLKDPTIVQRMGATLSKRHKEGKFDNATDALAQCNEHSHRLAVERYHNSEKYQTVLAINEMFGIDYERLPHDKKISYHHKYTNALKRSKNNHKVASVRFLDEVADVYDITTEKNHNFALSAGVFVHNSKDSSDAVTGALYNASQHASEYAFEYGERLEVMLEVDEPDYDAEVEDLLSEDDWARLRNMMTPEDQKEQAEEQDKGKKHRVAQPTMTRVSSVRNPNEQTIPTSGKGAGRSFVDDDDFIIL